MHVLQWVGHCLHCKLEVYVVGGHELSQVLAKVNTAGEVQEVQCRASIEHVLQFESHGSHLELVRL